jgi:biotin operon repressor
VAKSPYGLSRPEAARLLNVSAAQVSEAAAALAEAGLLIHRDRGETYTLPENRGRIAALIERALAAHHAAHPLRRRGLTAAEAAQAISGTAGRIGGEAVRAALEQALAAGALKQVEDSWALKGHAPKINAREEQAASELARRLEADLTPQQPEEALAELGLTKERLRHVLDYLREEGLALLAPGGVWFGAGQVQRVRKQLRAAPAAGGGFTVSDFNAQFATTRKFGIPLLQLLENEGTLVRDGDLRKLKG